MQITNLPIEVGNLILGKLALPDRDQVKTIEPFSAWNQDDFYSEEQIGLIIRKREFRRFKSAQHWKRLKVTHFLLLRGKRTMEKVASDFECAAKWTAACGHAEAFKHLMVAICPLLPVMSQASRQSIFEFALKVAARDGHASILNFLLSHKMNLNGSSSGGGGGGFVDFALDNNYAIRFAALNGHTEIVRLLLSSTLVKANSKFRADASENHPIRMAAANGNIEVVKLLLACPRVDPSAQNDRALDQAIRGGHTAVVNALLAHPKVDPSADHNWALRVAVLNGQADIVALLLGHPRVNATVLEDWALRNAAETGNVQVVKMLLEWRPSSVVKAAKSPSKPPPKKSGPVTRRTSAILQEQNHQNQQHEQQEQQEQERQRQIVNPGALDNWAIKKAAYNGHTKVVQLLLSDPRVDPRADNNFALKAATQNGHTDIVQLLGQYYGAK